MEVDREIVKKRKTSILHNLVDGNVGADFLYLDRDESFQILAESLSKRYLAWEKGVQTKENHPMPFLADGPGSGKSRFLQELPISFKKYVANSSDLSPEFKTVFSNALFINISFNSGATYSAEEISIGIQKSVCLRILHQFHEQEFTNFHSFYDHFKNDEFSLTSVLTKLCSDASASCVVLGIDEVNQLHTRSKEHFNELFRFVGGLCRSFTPFLVPVLAGTVIGPIKSIVTKSMFPPLHIPLPLLSFESCLNIIYQKETRYADMVRNSWQLRRLVADVGGHCRALEILYEGLEKKNSSLETYWDDVVDYVKHRISELYQPETIPLGPAIVYTFLSLDVDREEAYPGVPDLKFLDLEEKGLVKLENGKVIVPYVFVHCFLAINRTTPFAKFWKNILIGADYWWQDWEVFNCNYIAFRLSLFSYQGIRSISLQQLFNGAKFSKLADIRIKIPTESEIIVSKINYRYPSTKAPQFDSGNSVLNGGGAPFDSFIYLEQETPGNDDKRLLLALQTKLAYQDSGRPQLITNVLVNDEYQKINDTISNFIPGTDFVGVILGHCDGDFTEGNLPSNCVVVSKNEQKNFYGKAYYHRLNAM